MFVVFYSNHWIIISLKKRGFYGQTEMINKDKQNSLYPILIIPFRVINNFEIFTILSLLCELNETIIESTFGTRLKSTRRQFSLENSNIGNSLLSVVDSGYHPSHWIIITWFFEKEDFMERQKWLAGVNKTRYTPL